MTEEEELPLLRALLVRLEARKEASAGEDLRHYAEHAALNLGQAARDVRYLGDHPAADKVAPKGTAKHVAASVTSRVPSLASNLYYAALPPQLHHSEKELNQEGGKALSQLFLEGYAPWRYRKKTAMEKEEGFGDAFKSIGGKLQNAAQGFQYHLGTQMAQNPNWLNNPKPHAVLGLGAKAGLGMLQAQPGVVGTAGKALGTLRSASKYVPLAQGAMEMGKTVLSHDLRAFQEACGRLRSMKTASERLEANDAGTVPGTNHTGRSADETPGMEGGPSGYRWSQELPKDPVSTSGRTPGLEALSSSAETINADENLKILHRVFANMSEAQRADRELVARNFDHGKTGTYVTRSKTLMELLKDKRLLARTLFRAEQEPRGGTDGPS